MTTALVDGDDDYRYRVHGVVDRFNMETIAWVLATPGSVDVIRRCSMFTRLWGYGRFDVLNLFAARVASPADIYEHPAPIGPRNDDVIASVCVDADRVVAAWGSHGNAHDRALAVIALAHPHQLECLGTTPEGAPYNPLTASAQTLLRPWFPPQALWQL